MAARRTTPSKLLRRGLPAAAAGLAAVPAVAADTSCVNVACPAPAFVGSSFRLAPNAKQIDQGDTVAGPTATGCRAWSTATGTAWPAATSPPSSARRERRSTAGR